MESYIDMRKRHQEEVNAAPVFFAFSDKQFEAGMKKLQLTPDDTDKIYSIGFGGFIQRKDADAFHAMLDRHEAELHNAIHAEDGESGDAFAYSMFMYEMGNHEFHLTRDIEETLSPCGLTFDEVLDDQHLSLSFQNAKRDFIQMADEKGWY